MAEIKKINARIILRNGSAENLETSTNELLNGEPIISKQEDESYLLRIGNGGTFNKASKVIIDDLPELKDKVSKLESDINDLKSEDTSIESTYATKQELVNQIDTLTTDITDKLDAKANASNTLAGYGITDSYNKAEIDSTISSINDEINKKLNISDLSDVYTKTEIDNKESEIIDSIKSIKTITDNYLTPDDKKSLEEKITAEETRAKESEGDLEESIKNKADKTDLESYYVKNEIDDKLTEINASIDKKLNIEDFQTSSSYTKDETDAIISSLNETIAKKIEADDIPDVYLKSEIDTKISDINDSIATKLNISDLPDSYTKNETDAKISSLNETLTINISSIKTTLDVVDSNASAAKSNSETNASNINTLFARFDQDEIKIQNNETNISGLQQYVANQDNQISEISTKLDGNTNNITSLFSKIDTTNETLSTVKSSIEEETKSRKEQDEIIFNKIDSIFSDINDSIDTKLNISDLPDVYTKTEIDNKEKSITDSITSANSKIEAIETNISNLESDINSVSKNITDNYYSKTEINSISSSLEQSISDGIASVYRYKDSVKDYSALEAITEHEIGDVYNVEDTGDNYAWDGNSWDKLGGDLGKYALKDDYYTKSDIDTKVNELTSSIDAKTDKTQLSDYYTKSEITEKETSITSNIENLSSNVSQNYFTKEEINTKESALTSSIKSITDDYLVSSDKSDLTTLIDNALTTLRSEDSSNFNTLSSDLSTLRNNLTTKSDISTVSGLETIIQNKADLSNVYVKSEIDTKINLINTELTAKLVSNDITSIQEQTNTNKTNIETLSNTLTNDYLTESEIDQELTDIQSGLNESISYAVSTKIETDIDPKITTINSTLSNKVDLSSVYTQSEIDTKLSDKANLSDIPEIPSVYTTDQIDNLLSAKADTSNVYNKTEIDDKVTAITSDVSTLSSNVNLKADTSTLNVKANLSATLQMFGFNIKDYPNNRYITSAYTLSNLNDAKTPGIYFCIDDAKNLPEPGLGILFTACTLHNTQNQCYYQLFISNGYYNNTSTIRAVPKIYCRRINSWSVDKTNWSQWYQLYSDYASTTWATEQFYTKSIISSLLDNKADISNLTDLSNSYYRKSEIDTKEQTISGITDSLSSDISALQSNQITAIKDNAGTSFKPSNGVVDLKSAKMDFAHKTYNLSTEWSDFARLERDHSLYIYTDELNNEYYRTQYPSEDLSSLTANINNIPNVSGVSSMITNTTDSMQTDIETLQNNEKSYAQSVDWIYGGRLASNGTIDLSSAWVESATQLKTSNNNNLLTIEYGRIQISGQYDYMIQSPNDTSSVIFGDDIPNMHTVSAWVEENIPISAITNFDGTELSVIDKVAKLDKAYVWKADYSNALSCQNISGTSMTLLSNDVFGYEWQLSDNNGIIQTIKLPTDYSTRLIADADISAEREVLANISGNVLTSIDDGNGHTFYVSNNTVSLDGMLAHGAEILSSILVGAYMTLRSPQTDISQPEIQYTNQNGDTFNVRYNKSGLNVVDANLSDYVYSKSEIDTKIGDIETLLANI